MSPIRRGGLARREEGVWWKGMESEEPEGCPGDVGNGGEWAPGGTKGGTTDDGRSSVESMGDKILTIMPV